MNLKDFGLTPRFEQEATLYPDLFLARVSSQTHDLYTVITEEGEMLASITGKLLHEIRALEEFPAVGDWVMVDRKNSQMGYGQIHQVLTRKSVFARKAAGTRNQVQVVAANVDTIFICMAIGNDYNLRRLERYLTIAYDSMATPVVVLTKADLVQDLNALLDEIASVSIGTNVIVTSQQDEAGIQRIKKYLSNNQTVAFIGSSGVGKSTLINRLMGRRILSTQSVRQSDQKGRHTTTKRQLLRVPGGGVVIDTPGMRELQIESGNVGQAFSEVGDLASQCRFSDCKHQGEPGCAVQNALLDGTLTQDRLESYKKLQREASYEGLTSRQKEVEKYKSVFDSMQAGKKIMKEIKKNSKKR